MQHEIRTPLPTPRPVDNPTTTARLPVHSVVPLVRLPIFPMNEQPSAPTPARNITGAPPAGGNNAPTTVTDKAGTLARLIAEGRRPKSRRFAELEPYRDVLLTERGAGASIRLMAESLAKLGVNVSEETLRVWLLRQKMPKRRKPRVKPVALSESPVPPTPAPTGPVPVISRVLPNPPAVPIVPTSVQPPVIPHWQRKGPRIARNDY